MTLTRFGERSRSTLVQLSWDEGLVTLYSPLAHIAFREGDRSRVLYLCGSRLVDGNVCACSPSSCVSACAQSTRLCTFAAAPPSIRSCGLSRSLTFTDSIHYDIKTFLGRSPAAMFGKKGGEGPVGAQGGSGTRWLLTARLPAKEPPSLASCRYDAL